METIKRTSNPSPKKTGVMQKLASIGVVVAGLSGGGDSLAQQNPDPIPVSMSSVISAEIKSTQERIGTILKQQNLKDWIIPAAVIGGPLGLAGVLLSQGKKRRNNKKLGESPQDEKDDYLDEKDDYLDEKDDYLDEILNGTFDNLDALSEAKVMVSYGRAIEAIQMMGAKFDSEEKERESITLQDYDFVFRLIYSTKQLDLNNDTVLKEGVKKGSNISLPSKKKLFDKYFTLLLQETHIPLEKINFFAEMGKEIDPENPLYNTISQNLSTPA